VNPMGSAKNHGDAAAVLKRWTAAEATRREVSECKEVFQVLGRVAMGPHDGPRDEAIEVMGLMCEDEKVSFLSMIHCFGDGAPPGFKDLGFYATCSRHIPTTGPVVGCLHVETFDRDVPIWVAFVFHHRNLPQTSRSRALT
jgi:hypothetical protein